MIVYSNTNWSITPDKIKSIIARIVWNQPWQKLKYSDFSNLLPCVGVLWCFAAPTDRWCSVACSQGLSGFTPCSRTTTASAPWRPTGLWAYTTTSTDTCTTSSGATTTSLCWLQATMATSSASVSLLPVSFRSAYTQWGSRSHLQGSVFIWMFCLSQINKKWFKVTNNIYYYFDVCK